MLIYLGKTRVLILPPPLPIPPPLNLSKYQCIYIEEPPIDLINSASIAVHLHVIQGSAHVSSEWHADIDRVFTSRHYQFTREPSLSN